MTEPSEHVMEAIRKQAVNREADPRGPDAPDKHREGEARPEQLPERLGEHPDLSTGKASRHRRALMVAVGPPPIRWIGTKYNFDQGHSVQGIVIHTEVGTNASATGRFQLPNQASAHYGVAYDGGEAVQWVSEQNTAWHCGRYYPDASHMGNTNSIGIEHEDRGQYNSPRPDGLYETSARLVAWICQRYGIPINRSTVRGECGHRDVSITGTACPDSLDIGRVIARANVLANPPVPPVTPPWKLALHAEPYSVVLSGQVPLYDIETGAATGLKIGPTLTFAYRGTVAGTDWRVTQYSFDHNTPAGAKTADVATPPPPIPVPEWKLHLVPFTQTYRLRVPVDLINLETLVKTGKQVAAGPLTVQWGTKVQGKSYAMTDYSVSRNIPNGMFDDDILASDTPTPPVDPPVNPDNPPAPPPGALGWLQALLDWLKRLFPGAK